jgi:hypothetical protein
MFQPSEDTHLLEWETYDAWFDEPFDTALGPDLSFDTGDDVVDAQNEVSHPSALNREPIVSLTEPVASGPGPRMTGDRAEPRIDQIQRLILPSAGSEPMGIRPFHSQPDQFAGETVMRRLRAITGVTAPQKALIALRKGLFKSIVPRVTRDESREKTLNVATIEQYRVPILAILETPEAIAAVLDVVLREMKRPAHREEVLMHQHGIA